jgi:hypothetical protein
MAGKGRGKRPVPGHAEAGQLAARESRRADSPGFTARADGKFFAEENGILQAIAALSLASLGKANSYPSHKPGPLRRIAGQRQRGARQRGSIQGFCDGKSLTKPARTGTKQFRLVGSSPLSHALDAVFWLDGTDQYRRSYATNEIEAPMQPVHFVNVQVARRSEHACSPIRASHSEAVRCRVACIIAFRFDNHPSDAIDDKARADQLARDKVNIPVKEGFADPGQGHPRKAAHFAAACDEIYRGTARNWNVGATRCKGGADFR